MSSAAQTSDKGQVPELRFAEFEGDWETSKLEDIASVARGKFSARPRNDPRYYGGDIPFVQTGDVVRASRRLTGFSQTLNNKGLRVSRAFPKNTILMTIAANIGDVAITDFVVSCPDSVVAINGKEHFDTDFLYDCLSLKKSDLEAVAATNAQANINLQILNPLKICTPSLPEQEKIASFLSAVDEKIAQLSAKKHLLEQYKKGCMQKLFSQQIRFTRPDGSPFPDWEEGQLSDYCDSMSGHPVSGDDIHETQTAVRLLRGINITEGSVRHSPDMDRFHGGDISGLERYFVRLGDIVMGMDGSKVGRNVAIISDSDDGAFLIQRVARFRGNNTNCLQFAYHHVFSVHFHRYVGRINTSSGIPHISLKQIREFSIPLPHPDEQQKIADFLTAIDDKINLTTRNLTHAKAFKEGLLQQMFV